MICIYHSRDLDGFASGAIVKTKYPLCKMIGYDYGQPFPWQEIEDGEQVFMVDVSLPMNDMEILAIKTDFTWIDHHISAINDYKNFINTPRAAVSGLERSTIVLENGIAACEGTWKHCWPDRNIPEAILLLGEYDTWRNGDKQRWENRILPFQFGARIECNSVESFPAYMFGNLPSFVEQTIANGEIVLAYQGMINEAQCKKAAFESHIIGPNGTSYSAICLNGGGFNSDVFKSVYDPEKHQLMVPYQFDGKKWIVSLYTTHDDIDCSTIAKHFGGGGHRKASGFSVTNLDDLPML